MFEMFSEHRKASEYAIFFIISMVVSSLMKFNCVVSLQLSSTKWTEKCPAECICEIDSMSKKAVICSDVHLDRIPTHEMDTESQVSQFFNYSVRFFQFVNRISQLSFFTQV